MIESGREERENVYIADYRISCELAEITEISEEAELLKLWTYLYCVLPASSCQKNQITISNGEVFLALSAEEL